MPPAEGRRTDALCHGKSGYPDGVRTSGHHRKHPKRLADPLNPAELTRIADNCSYIGSPEHKNYKSFAGEPALRSDATPCPTTFKDPAPLTELLKDAVKGM
jgi:hypothetical protein